MGSPKNTSVAAVRRIPTAVDRGTERTDVNALFGDVANLERQVPRALPERCGHLRLGHRQAHRGEEGGGQLGAQLEVERGGAVAGQACDPGRTRPRQGDRAAVEQRIEAAAGLDPPPGADGQHVQWRDAGAGGPHDVGPVDVTNLAGEWVLPCTRYESHEDSLLQVTTP